MPESLQTQAEALLDQLPQPASQPITDYSRLSLADIAHILRLADAKYTQTYIAEQVQCSQPTVSRILNIFSDHRDLAQRRANNASLEMVESMIRGAKKAEEQGKSGPQEGVLTVARLMKSDESSGPKVIVQIGVKDSDVKISLGSSE